MLSIALPHPWEDEWKLVLHLLEECSSADRVECIGKVQGDQCLVWMVTQEVTDSIHYVLSTSWHAHSKLHRENVPGSFFLRLHMMAELMSLWKMVPVAMGLMPPYFLAIGISLVPKKNGLRCSWMNSGGWQLSSCIAYRWH